MLSFESAFGDAASLVLRQMLVHPDREWVVRDFEADLGVGRGWAAEIVALLRKKGFVKGESRGRLAGAVLRDASALIEEWTKHYDIEWSNSSLYYSPDPALLPKIKRYLSQQGLQDRYALTLHSGANLITHFVRDSNIYIYLEASTFEKTALSLRKVFDLKELKDGGNIHLMVPYYKRSAFFGVRKIQGYPVVSNLQLYLDLFHFPQRGREHAEYLLRALKMEGQALA